MAAEDVGAQGSPRGALLGCGGAALLGAAFSLKRLADPDGFWMLAAGRLVLESGIPSRNTLSHTFPDYPWHFTQWLFAAALAGAERLGGIPAVQVLLMACAAALCVALVQTVRHGRGGAYWPVFLPLLVATVAGVQFRITPRGDVGTLLGLAAVALLWTLRPRGLALWAGALGALWGNVHAGTPFGVFAWACVALACALRRERKEAWQALAALGAFLLGSLVNPSGWYAYRYLAESAALAGKLPVLIAEGKRPAPAQFPIFYGLAAFGTLLLARAARARDWAHVLLFVGFGLLALRYLRFVPYFLVMTLPGTARHASSLARGVGGTGGVLRRRSVRRAVAAACLTGLGWAIVFEVGHGAARAPAGWGVAGRRYPERTCDYLQQRALPGELFNEYSDGGYVAWRLFPGRRVFVDGRTLAYPLAFVQQALAPRPAALSGLLDRHHVDLAIVRRRPRGSLMDLCPQFERLGWRPVSLESAAVLFVRPGSAAWDATAGDGFAVVRPWQSPERVLTAARENPEGARDELARVATPPPTDPADALLFGYVALEAGAPALAHVFFSAGLARDPGGLDLRLGQARALAGEGRVAEASAMLERIARDAAPDTPQAASAREGLAELRRAGR